MITRICKQCGIEKLLSEFHKSKVHKGGRKPICGSCYNWNHRSEKNKEIELEKCDFAKRGVKRCACCNNVKSISEFPPDRSRKDKLYVYCKECKKRKELEHSRRPDIKLKRKERESSQEYLDKLAEYRRNSVKYQQTLKIYRERTLERRRKRNRKYSKRLYVRIRNNISTRIRNELKLWDKYKVSSFNEYLGCTIKYFIHYIESKFTEGMSWDKWGKGNGKFHIDHIIPCANFDFTKDEEIRKCFHFSNLQPLWEPDNLRKTSKINGKKIYKKNTNKKVVSL